MQRILNGLMSIFIAGGSTTFAAEESTNTGSDWNLSAQEKDVVIYSRPRPGSQLKEFKAVGPIDAPTGAVCAVIDDFQNYPKFMPYTTECRLIKRDGDSIVGYQRLSPKVCADRDYTLRVWKKSWSTPNGLVFASHWSPANELGPPEKKGVVRVKLCEGKWLLEPDGATKTRATYFIYTDTVVISRPSLPIVLARRGSQNSSQPSASRLKIQNTPFRCLVVRHQQLDKRALEKMSKHEWRLMKKTRNPNDQWRKPGKIRDSMSPCKDSTI